jgi:Ulp1 protease family, C-terminal catalytic domain
LLHAIEGATAEGLVQKMPCAHLRLSHETNQKLQCQDMRTFDEFFDDNCFVSAALQGTEPSKDELDSMWKQASEAAELKYDEKLEKWTTLPAGLPTKTLGNTDGSLHTTSWEQLQQALLSALESDAVSAPESDAAICPAPLRTRELRSPPRSACANSGELRRPPRSACANSGDVTFMDAGSESGKAMYRMMSDKRIRHVAGVELQQAWYDASCKIMAHLRRVFKAKNYRMPAVTIVCSCMVAAKPELTYLYSIASLMWMNNYVFHRVEYFAANKSNKSAPMPLLQGCRDLTTNAALRFSQTCSGVTYIAVHEPAGFMPRWNYTCFKPFNTRVTWGTSECKVTIIRHIQQLEITGEDMGQKTRYALPIPNREELQLWDDCMKKWSHLIPTLYKAISEEVFNTGRLRGTLANNSILDQERHLEKSNGKTHVVGVDSDDEPVRSWSFEDAAAASSASKLTQAMPSATNVDWTILVTLTDSNWLASEIMVAYKELLKQQFPTILFLDLNATVKGKDLKSRQVLVGYINLNNNHWIAAKLDLTQNFAAIADSLKTTYQLEHAAVFDKLQTMATLAGHTQQLQRFTVEVPDQRNTNDCGVCACLFQLYMAQTVSA